MKKIFIAFPELVLLIIGGGVQNNLLSNTTNLYNYETIGCIPTSSEYKRIEGGDAGFASYLRNLPLKHWGSEITLAVTLTSICSRTGEASCSPHGLRWMRMMMSSFSRSSTIRKKT